MRFARYSLGVLIYNLLVVLWGAYVRATGSGAGCGAHWPLCNGVVVPLQPATETVIEFVHRVTSGLTLPLVIVLAVWAFRSFSKGSAVRISAILAVIFTITEALVGAGLVLFGLVADNDSFARAYVMIIHLLNTFLLLACLGVTTYRAYYPDGNRPDFGRPGVVLYLMGLVGMLILGSSGAVAALGDTLFPSESLSQALQADFSAASHLLIRLRVFHPIIAVLVSVYFIFLSLRAAKQAGASRTRNLADILVGILVLQLALGVINVLLLAPVWMQLVHLLVSDLAWLTAVVLTFNLAERVPSSVSSVTGLREAPSSQG